MKNKEINIRDPYILVAKGKYYLYGTRAATCWGFADGFDCYVGTDIENWEGPIEIFHRPKDFWADKNFWAPEVHAYRDKYYLFATFNSSQTEIKGTQILVADQPEGPFGLLSDGPVTPRNWNCIDGTFYLSPKGVPYIVFCHEWIDSGDGTICYAQLSEDLSRTIEAPTVLFKASDAKQWVRQINHPRLGTNYITDGPFLYRMINGELILLWSSFGEEGYMECIARSSNGDITGEWSHCDQPLYMKDGGHGMLFHTLEQQLFFVLHTPNTKLEEYPVFYEVVEQQGTLSLLSGH